MERKRHGESVAEPIRTREKMAHRRSWQCACGATLVIKAHDARAEGPSNFVVDTNPRRQTFGHALTPSGRLTWEGLRDERGWEREGDQVQCPACVQGRTRDAHRLMSRFQPERVGAEIAARHITRQSGGAIQAEAVFTILKAR
jgi:hypothetical protein